MGIEDGKNYDATIASDTTNTEHQYSGPLSIQAVNFIREHKLNRPTFTQDGTEIHQDLVGLIFKFYQHPDGDGNGVAVFYDGATNVPWANRLTGLVFPTFADAKHWLREESEKQSGQQLTHSPEIS